MHADPTSTLQRQWAMLRLIPAWPQSITVSALKAAVHREGFRPARSTVERDLDVLSICFPIVVDTSGKTFRWSWAQSASIEFLPRPSVSMCLAVTLALQHARELLPQSMLDDLAPLFELAERELAPTPWKDWHKRTAVVPPAFVLQPPKFPAKTLSDAQHALAHRLCLTANYRSKGNPVAKPRKLHPLGMLVRGSVQYLVCMQGDDREPRQFAVHRMQEAAVSSEPCRELHGFSMAHYAARSLAINSHGSIRVRLHVLDTAAEHLRETTLSKYQTWQPIAGTDKVEISATVDDDLQLKRYLLSFGSEVEVMEPERVRKDIAEELWKAAGAYRE